MLIRKATAEDWPGIFPIFAAVVAAGDSYAYSDDLSSDQARHLWMETSPGHCVVAVHGDRPGRLLGTAKMGPNRPGRGAHVSTASFMVNPAYRRTGTGRALGHYALNWARQAGYRSMQFNAVVETNTAAVRLWRELGFEIIGTVPEAFQHRDFGLVGLHVMYQRL